MVTDDPIVRQLLEILTRVAGPSRRPSEPDGRTPLASGGFWLDSIDLVEVMIACDEVFGPVFVDGRGRAGQELATVADLAAVIRERTGG